MYQMCFLKSNMAATKADNIFNDINFDEKYKNFNQYFNENCWRYSYQKV